MIASLEKVSGGAHWLRSFGRAEPAMSKLQRVEWLRLGLARQFQDETKLVPTGRPKFVSRIT
jgi:hypothetical protein